LERLKERDQLENLRVDWRIRLQDWTGLEDKVTGLDWIGG